MGDASARICLVTGAGRGIGAVAAERLAHAGCLVILTARTAADIERVQQHIESAGGQAEAIAGDLRDTRFIDQLFTRIEQRHGRLDVLINNAGTAVFGSVTQLPASSLRDCLELNVVAAYACMQHAVRIMKRTGDCGKIINIGSVRSHWTEAGDAGAYNASKFALKALTESIARELHGTGSHISVGMVCPGVVDTSQTNPEREARPDWLSPDVVAEAICYAALAPDTVNMYDITLFPVSQRPW